MEIIYHRKFVKAFSKLLRKQQERIDESIVLFRQNPFDPQLNNHALHGKQKEQRSISVGGDLRIVFVEKNNYESVLFLNVGIHTQVYK